jgi:hypothetical protein
LNALPSRQRRLVAVGLACRHSFQRLHTVHDQPLFSLGRRFPSPCSCAVSWPSRSMGAPAPHPGTPLAMRMRLCAACTPGAPSYPMPSRLLMPTAHPSACSSAWRVVCVLPVLQDTNFRFDWMPSATVFLLTAGCSASADVLSALLTIERPPSNCQDAFEFTSVLAQTCYWVPEPTDATGRLLSQSSNAAGDDDTASDNGEQKPAPTLSFSFPNGTSATIASSALIWDAKTQFRSGDLVMLPPSALILSVESFNIASIPHYRLVGTCKPGFHPRSMHSRITQVRHAWCRRRRRRPWCRCCRV